MNAQKTAIIGGEIHVGNGEVISNGLLVFEQEKILYVGLQNGYTLTDDVKEIEAQGKHIYPSLIAPNTTLGLVEVEAVRSTRDYSEVGNINPNIRAITAYNVASKIIPTIRTNGVLLAQITPQGSLVTGSSSVVKLDANTKEDAIVKEDDGIHIFWAQRYWQYDWFSRAGQIKANSKRKAHLKTLKTLFDDATIYQKSHSKENLKLKAISSLFDSEKRLYIHVDDAKEILEAIAFFEQYKINNKVIVGGRDSWKVAEVLKEKQVSVVLSRIHDLPTRVDERSNLLYEQPALLQKAGVLFCLNYMGDMEAMGQRNLPFTAGTAVGYGLTKEEALQSISLNAAKIMGVDAEVGSLEVGKKATFFISKGDVLDMRTSIVEFAFIDGEQISLESHHTELYKKYKK